MAEAIKSALFVDYESLHRSLAGAGAPGDTRLADRAAAWLAAIETGRLLGPQGTRRRLVSKRCYAGSTVLGKQRDALAAAGFEVVDCGSGDPGGRGSADMHLAIDTIDALAKPAGVDEFILLTASSDLAPLLSRLKASKRLAAIYADASTPRDEKALADALLDSAAFAEFLSSDEVPVSEERSAKAAADRAAIEEFARRVHAATNIPLFSPKTFAELFKHLTDEIRENGYHFQTTARNVAERMTETGRSVTRRQVVFIVKGLALKGHVFSTGDTPDGLAEVFREQARYLITNAGMNLDDRQDELLNAWFVSRVPTPPAPQAKPMPAPAISKAAPNGATISGQNGSKPPPQAAREPIAAAQQAPSAAIVEQATAAPPAAAKAPPPPAPRVPAKAPPAARRPVEVKPVELPKAAARPAATAIKAPPSPAAREEAKAVIAARIAASARLKPAAARPATTAKPAAKSPAAPSPAKAAPTRRTTAEQASDALETSILAAIAEAVDVLVDDGAKEETPRAEQAARRKPNGPPAPPEPRPEQADGEGDEAADGGDIGDQIQRIIASYNRNRNDE
jgi:hypothetical protein